MDDMNHVDTITIIANGQARIVKAGYMVADLLQELNIMPKYVVVQLDSEIVPRTGFDQAALREGSKVEIITLAGGGAEVDSLSLPTRTVPG
ncbi:MAG TPA: sulfur carrier protein ThiS [Ktedonobacteraceae bacterium]|nr:sulfur carrier protein ThiS [Ktedonobacteraceae bacterium]